MAWVNGENARIPENSEEEHDVATERPERGLDSSLQKHAPKNEGLDAASYKTFRRKLETYQRMCQRRSQNFAVEAAFGIFAALQETHWDITETIDLESIEMRHFEAIKEVLDPLFKYGQDIEVPKRGREFFYDSSRKRQRRCSNMCQDTSRKDKSCESARLRFPTCWLDGTCYPGQRYHLGRKCKFERCVLEA